MKSINLSGYNPEINLDAGTSIESNFFETSALKGNIIDNIKNEDLIIDDIFIIIPDIYLDNISLPEDKIEKS